MRYFGNKIKLLKTIENFIEDNIKDECINFIDGFGGSGTVGRHFKQRYKLINNDIMYCSYIFNRAVCINTPPAFKNLPYQSPIDYLNNNEIVYEGFTYNNYTPAGNRMYFTEFNGRRIDGIRKVIEEWKDDGLINDDEYYILLASLLEAVLDWGNTTGGFSAYLKKFDGKANKDFKIREFNIGEGIYENNSYNVPILDLFDKLDYIDPAETICYLDPPYTTKTYSSMLHLSETVALNDNPNIRGLTGLRECDKKSKFSSKRECYKAFDDLVSAIKAKHIIISYSSDSILSKDQMLEILNKHCHGVVCKETEYKRYASKTSEKNKLLYEYLFYAIKN